ncbi:MAG: TraR/DksA C4-type zinc finger protein [Desulfobacteraceae bacterium]
MEKKQIKDKILDEIARTEKQILSYKKNTKPVAPDNAIGRISRMDAIVNKSLIEASLNQAEIRLDKLKYVLSEIESPEFGICINCGEAIPIGRLLIIPETLLCVNCAK